MRSPCRFAPLLLLLVDLVLLLLLLLPVLVLAFAACVLYCSLLSFPY